jgi:hypothetical protein
MAQKAGAVITPVVARHGCAEDLQDEDVASSRRKNNKSKKQGSSEARARRAEHHTPKLRTRLARELELASDLPGHYKVRFRDLISSRA